MNRILHLFYLLTMLFFASSSYGANSNANHSNFNSEQQAQIQSIVRDYLLKNPQVLLEAIGKLQEQNDQQNQQKVQKVVANYANTLLNAPNSPVFGNPKGDITLVEFFDYQCPYCKQVSYNLDKLIQANPNLRIVLKEWPIFGESSEFASRAALAAQMQQKYSAFHQALMQQKGRLSNEDILKIAKNTGLDMNKLQADMNNKNVMSELKNNNVLAHALELAGTPAFIIMKTYGNPQQNKIIFIPGAASISTLQKAIKETS